MEDGMEPPHGARRGEESTPDGSPWNGISCSRRRLVAVAGGILASGCTSLRPGGPSDRLPVLVSLAVANDTDDERAYRVRVRRADDGEAAAETVFESDGVVRARERTDIDGDWPKAPGRHAVDVAVDGGNWRTRDVTDRFAQEERVCYRQELSIGDDGVTFWTDVDASCPDP